MTDRYRLSIEDIQKFLPHRSPFLLVDRILEIVPMGGLEHNGKFGREHVGTKVRGLKNVTYNEFFMPGHFPKLAIVPGVLLVEILAQTASFSLYPFIESEVKDGTADFQCVLVGVDKVRFRKPVVPGDTLVTETVATVVRGDLWGFECKAMVESNIVCEAELLAKIGLPPKGRA